MYALENRPHGRDDIVLAQLSGSCHLDLVDIF